MATCLIKHRGSCTVPLPYLNVLSLIKYSLSSCTVICIPVNWRQIVAGGRGTAAGWWIKMTAKRPFIPPPLPRRRKESHGTPVILLIEPVKFGAHIYKPWIVGIHCIFIPRWKLSSSSRHTSILHESFLFRFLATSRPFSKVGDKDCYVLQCLCNIW
jgi:hypothetical protein